MSFITSRWRGDVSLKRVFLHDMLVVGTMVNVAVTLCALLLFASEVPNGIGVAVFFSPLPYNVFLFVAVWNSSANTAESLRTVARLMAPLWLTLMTLL
ncbi:MAG: hypothetical protein OEQ39_19975 [Gammaproteobacteria bacterium]|nr:hypothetical protein [Gammaproteobacteria bacterium]